MDLGNQWTWKSTRLACKIREETGNPAVDDLREQLQSLLDKREEFETRKNEALPGSGYRYPSLKKDAKGGSGDADPWVSDKGTNAILHSATKVLEESNEHEQVESVSKMLKNIHRRHLTVPTSPPKRIRDGMTMANLNFRHLEIDMANAAAQQRRASKLQGEMAPESGGTKNNGTATYRRKLTYGEAQITADSPDSVARYLTRPRDSSTDDGESTMPDVSSLLSKGGKEYRGDIFGTRANYMGGMVYLSRMPNREASAALSGSFLGAPKNEPEEAPDASKSTRQAAKTATHPLMDEKNRRDKLNCIKLLCDWSLDAENSALLVEEGAVEALVNFSMEADKEIRLATAYAFRIFSFQEALLTKMVEQKCVPSLSELALHSGDADIYRECTMALVNLTMLRGPEDRLVEDGIVLAFSSIYENDETLLELCAHGLYNLTVIRETYPHVERIIKAFVYLTPHAGAPIRRIAVDAFLNLSEKETIHKRMIDEGLIRVLETCAASNDLDLDCARKIASVVENISRTPSCRDQMLDKGVLPMLERLTKYRDLNILISVAAVLLNAALEEGARRRLLEGGVVPMTIRIIEHVQRTSSEDLATFSEANGGADAALRLYYKCASIFDLVSRVSLGHHIMINEGCLPSLMKILTYSRAGGHDSIIVCITNCIANLAIFPEDHKPVLQAGGVKQIMALSEDASVSADIKGACARAFFNLSNNQDMRTALMQYKVLDVIINFSRDPDLFLYVAASLNNLSMDELNISKIINEELLGVLIRLLSVDSTLEIVKFACSTLCHLAVDNTAAQLLMKLEVLEKLFAIIEHAEEELKIEYCGALLAVITSHDFCRGIIIQQGGLDVFLKLSSLEDADVQMQCLVAFANLSYEDSSREEMVEKGVIAIVERLSHVYSENAQLYAARTVCNLACVPGAERIILEQGGLRMLMTICMVRSVNITSKQFCAVAFRNLLSDETYQVMIKEGLVMVVSSLTRSLDRQCMMLCSEMFLYLSALEKGAQAILEKSSSITSICDVVRQGRDQHSRETAGRVLCNLFQCEPNGLTVLAATSGLQSLTIYAGFCEPEMQIQVMVNIYKLMQMEGNMNKLLQYDVVPRVGHIYQSTTCADTRRLCLLVLYHFVPDNEAREQMLLEGIMGHILEDLQSHRAAESYEFRFLYLLTDLFGQVCLESESWRRKILAQNGLSLVPLLLERVAAAAPPGEDGVSAEYLTVFDILSCATAALCEDEDLLTHFVAHGGIACIQKLAVEANKLVKLDIAGEENRKRLTDAVVYIISAAYTVFRNPRSQKEALKALLAPLSEFIEVREARPFLVSIFVVFAETADSIGEITMESVVELINIILEGSDDEDSLVNCCGILYLMTNSEEGRELLQSMGCVQHLVHLTTSDNEEIKRCISEAIKNMSKHKTRSRIESGTVRALINITMSHEPSAAEITAAHVCKHVFRPVDWLHEGHFQKTMRNVPDAVMALFEGFTLPRVPITHVELTKKEGGTAERVPPIPPPPTLRLTEASSNKWIYMPDELFVADVAHLAAKLGVPDEYQIPYNIFGGISGDADAHHGFGSKPTTPENSKRRRQGTLPVVNEDAGDVSPPRSRDASRGKITVSAGNRRRAGKKKGKSKRRNSTHGGNEQRLVSLKSADGDFYSRHSLMTPPGCDADMSGMVAAAVATGQLSPMHPVFAQSMPELRGSDKMLEKPLSLDDLLRGTGEQQGGEVIHNPAFPRERARSTLQVTLV
mmetsp:Transcript_43927/g.138054  ORF Transcript_43927/g.138054 Transcript_43927/m.138054 type:complete len:1733 (-) Transcript_43927:50-5248(-)